MPGTISPLRNLLPRKYEPVSAKLNEVNAAGPNPANGHDLAPLPTWHGHPKEIRMKLKNLWAAPLALGIVMASGRLTPTLQAQSQSQAPSAQQDQQKSQTFVGKIVKTKDGRFALLTDEQTGKGVYLDDQQKAAQFEGKNVKVTGTLEASRALIHVSNIEPA
jgi:hypothetical protein